MRLETDIKLDFQDVLLKPKRSTITSRSEVTLERDFHFKYSKNTWTGVPIISSNMTSVTNHDVAKVMANEKMLVCYPKNTGRYSGFVKQIYYGGDYIKTYGINDIPAEPLVIDSSFICLDIANGYIEKFVKLVSLWRKAYDGVIIAGNVVTPEMTEALILAGADIVKVGVGSGSACATRIKTGVGYPQLSAVAECADAAHGLGAHIISDGGCTTPGDIVKAFAAGADFVMLGGMLAGTDENGQDFYGMSSKRANQEISGGLKNYRSAEGWEMKLPKKGPLKDVLQDIQGGLRSACAYVGARRLKDLPKCATFIQINRILNTSLLEYRID